jgi:DNA helicase-2/ATP-dependent DNA helicase PcrA
MPPEIDLFVAERGSVTAPAGCGKTQLIADTLSEHHGPKPILILTHTNAGVSALRARMQRAHIRNEAYRIMTIDGFAIRLIRKFPMRSGHDPRILELGNRNADYIAIRNAALQLARAGHLRDVLRASYARILVDEYQDCNQPQHQLVSAIADFVPTCVLGDPMQAIFGFGGNVLVNWVADVLPRFPAIGQLHVPWRWRQAGAEALGIWLLQARAWLEAGQGVDLRAAPAEVQWVQLRQPFVRQQRMTAAATIAENNGKVIIICESMNANARHTISSQTFGASIVEPVDLPDLVTFSRNFNLAGADPIAPLTNFAAELMTQVGPAQFLPRVQTIRNGRNRTPPTVAEAAAVVFSNAPTWRNAIAVVHALENQHNARVYRPEMYHCLCRAMNLAAGGVHTLHQAVLMERERYRHLGRPLARRSVGSTLLVKGLEADMAVVLFPETMGAQDLYVAMTRGARQLVICSENPVLQPAAPRIH